MHSNNMQIFNISKFGNSRSSNQLDQQNLVFSTVEDFVARFSEDPRKARSIRKVLI